MGSDVLTLTHGVGGPAGGAMLLGGSILALDGLRRGDRRGSRLRRGDRALVSSKARRKIKALYGVDISDKGVLKQIADTAKQAYGGNIDLAIRSPQIRDLIQLYAMTTGQKPKGMPGTVTPLSLIEMGGSLFQASSYSNGSPLPGLGGLPTLDRIGRGTPAAAQPLVIQLDGPATTALLRGEAVQAIVDNPRAVQGAAMNAARSNAGRREMTSLQLSPGLLTS
jgi:hypothetical protein